MLNDFYRSINKSEQKHGFADFLSVFLLVAIRFLYFGFKYFPQLDDYIQHHNYAPQGSFFYLFENLGLLAARPLAGILDITLWSWLWPCSIIGVLILCVLYSLASLEFYKVFNKLFGTSKFFIVIFALLPLGIEGTYWMSASTRIIPGIFFAAFSASQLVRFFECGKNKNAILTILFQFLTFCFYEQTAVLSCALNVLVSFLYAKKSGKRWCISFSCICCAILYFLISSIHADSPLYSGRTEIILPISVYYFKVFLPELLSQIKSAFLGGGYYTLVYGFIRGVMRIISDGAWIYCLLLAAFAVFFYKASYKSGSITEKPKTALPIVFGVLLALAPLAPFFIISNPWFSFRGTVASFAGIALVCDAVIRLVTRNNGKAISVIGSLCAVVFCICSVSEVADYRSTYLADTKAVSRIATITQEIKAEFPDKSKVAVFNVDGRYVTELNANYHEHIHGVTESDWALTGAIRCYNNNPFEGITYVPFSLKDTYLYKNWNYASKNIGSMDAVYVYNYNDDTIEKLNVVAQDSAYELFYSNGDKYGTVVEQEGCATFVEE